MGEKAVLIGRHELLTKQEEALEQLGIEIVDRVEQVKDVREVIAKAEELGAKYIVIQALPFSLLMQLHGLAIEKKIEILLFTQQTIGTFKTKEDAETVAKVYEGATVILPSPEGTYRVVKFETVEKVETILVKTKRVWPNDA